MAGIVRVIFTGKTMSLPLSKVIKNLDKERIGLRLKTALKLIN
ncbi:MAG: hypothetical protein ACP5HC_02080 [Caldisericum sp.]